MHAAALDTLRLGNCKLLHVFSNLLDNQVFDMKTAALDTLSLSNCELFHVCAGLLNN